MSDMNLSCDILEMNESDRFQIFFDKKNVFDSEIIVCMLVYNTGPEIKDAINSIRSQETSRSISILIIDGGISDDWKKYIDKQSAVNKFFDNITTGIRTQEYKCGRCKEHNCSYTQLQTRCADEPMTTYINCLNCGNKWSFN